MKKWSIVPIVFVLLLFLTACNGSEDEATTTAANATTTGVIATTASNITTQSATATTTSAPTTQAVAVPSNTEVKDAYKKAFRVYDAFYLNQFSLGEDAAPSSLGAEYYKVNDFATLSSLKSHMESVLSNNLVNNLLAISPPVYSEVDGILYGREIIVGITGYGQETVAVVKNSDSQFMVTATVEILDDNENVIANEPHTSIYKLVNGKWVFTSFDYYLFL